MKYTRIKIFLFVILFLNFSFLASEITYRLSGKAVYNGTGISNIKIGCVSIEGEYAARMNSNSEGDFFCYVPKGLFRVYIFDGRGYINKDAEKIITVDSKNINNVIFFLEKECKVSGRIKFDDDTPIKDAQVAVYNERGSSIGSTDINGYYKISGLKSSENTSIKVHIPGAKIVNIENITLNEGDEITDMNFVLPHGLSIIGNVVDKDTQLQLNDILVYIYTKDKIMISSNYGSNGKFKIYNLSSGKYILLLLHAEYNYFYKEIQITGNETLNINVEMEKLSDEEIQAGKYYGLDM